MSLASGRKTGLPDKYSGSETLGRIIAEVGQVGVSLPGHNFVDGWSRNTGVHTTNL
jgi:hypothetical protein